MKTSNIHTVNCEDCECGVIEAYEGDEAIEYDCATCQGSGRVEKEIWGCDCESCQDLFYICTNSDDRFVSVYDSFSDAWVAANKLAEVQNEMFLIFKGQFSDRELAWIQGDEFRMSQAA